MLERCGDSGDDEWKRLSSGRYTEWYRPNGCTIDLELHRPSDNALVYKPVTPCGRIQEWDMARDSPCVFKRFYRSRVPFSVDGVSHDEF
jgi:hypothetical protein